MNNQATANPFTFEVNEVTGNTEAKFTAELMSVSKTSLEFNNEKKTKYRVGTAKFVDANNVEQSVSTIIYENNFTRTDDNGAVTQMEIGENYMTTAIFSKDAKYPEPLIIMSHLSGTAPRAKTSMFGDISAAFMSQATNANAETVGA
jgi:hypothetical protein